ncbi:MAG TPA: RidA family protein [Vineibacter sp.]|nr:RidA family protein [Vineibacter sp.]
MSRRLSVQIAGFRHVNPIPNAARVGNLLMSGVILGVDPDTHKMPADLETQCRNMFAHVRSIVEAGGGTMDDIVKMTVWLKDVTQRDVLNQVWVATFPDAQNRPARHALPIVGESPALIQCDLTAVIG